MNIDLNIEFLSSDWLNSNPISILICSLTGLGTWSKKLHADPSN